MPEAVLVSALRTPLGTAFKDTLRDTSAYDLAHHVVAAACASSAKSISSCTEFELSSAQPVCRTAITSW